MFKDEFAAIRQAFSGEVAKDHVAAIIRHHRIQASPGYRDAAEYVLTQLQEAGLRAQIETYPADHETKFWTASSFQEWEATNATLDLVEPAEQARRLADYRELKLSLIQRSIPFQGEAELVLLEDGLNEEEYEGQDVAGKIVLSKGPAEQVRQLAVEQFGAIGILFDGMNEAPPVREAMDLADARQYTSFWWSGQPGEKQCFGFVLSPKQGLWLRQLINKRSKQGQPPVKIRANVEARLYEGEIEVVTAVIPGERQPAESVIIVSHLCHPQPSANDNGTGVAANLEAARTLHHLIASGKLPQPARSIRFLWMPEMTGAYAYLSRHEAEIPQLIAGLNLDMVGEDQAQTGSVMLLERPPDAVASFAPDLLERLREELFDEAQTHAGMGGYPLFRYATTGFSGGSDHYIFSDPTVGVPMPMLIQWPDKFYHTSADTLDKVDPASLARSGTLAAAYAYFIASAGETKTRWLSHEMSTRFQVSLLQHVQARITESFGEGAKDLLPKLEREIDYRLSRHRTAMLTLRRLWGDVDAVLASLDPDAAQQADLVRERARELFGRAQDSQSTPPEKRDGWEEKAADLIPRREYRGPGIAIGSMAALSLSERRTWREMFHARSAGAHTIPVLAEYWADGRRTVLEIIDLVEMETGIRDPELIVRSFEILHRLDLVKLLRDDREVTI